jgi:hypothetical protein
MWDVVSGGGCTWENSMYFLFNFAMNLKLL